MKSESEVVQSCPTLSDAMDCSLPGSSVHGIFQARVLEWVAIASPTTHYSSPPDTTRMESLDTNVTDFQHILQRIQGGGQECSTLCSGETDRTSLQRNIFNGFYEPYFLLLLISRKALKSLI